MFRQTFKAHGHFVIIMDFCDSGDLAQHISNQQASQTYFPEATVQLWFAQILSAVDYLHCRRVMHRDIKPANVFVHRGNQLKLGDLGLSKTTLDATNPKFHTMCGSPLYLAPEVHMGEKSLASNTCPNPSSRADR